MNDNDRSLIRYVCDGDIAKAQTQARIILEGITSKKDINFKTTNLRKLDNHHANLIELPPNLKGLVVAEDVSAFPESRFLLRPGEDSIVQEMLNAYRAAEQLNILGIPYLPAVVLHGESGTGKTMLAKYIAYKAGLPFVWVRFSSLMDSLMGRTNANLSRIFDYAKKNPCVLCIDELDAIGMARTGDGGGTAGEMSRIVIGLMQELDTCPNSTMIVATTNRYDRLDEALISRFPHRHEVKRLSIEDTEVVATRFFESTGLDIGINITEWCASSFSGENITARALVQKCTGEVVRYLIAHPILTN